MRIVHVDKLEPGQILGRSLFGEGGELLHAAGFRLAGEAIRDIRNLDRDRVYLIDLPPDRRPPEDTLRHLVQAIVLRRVALREDDVLPDPLPELSSEEELRARVAGLPTWRHRERTEARVRDDVDVLLRALEVQLDVLAALPEACRSRDELEHAFNTACLSLALARTFDYSERDCLLLTSAALVHDTGRLVFPLLCGTAPEDLTPDDRSLLREHPVFSMMILRGSDPDTVEQQQTVLHHHERHDGMGYPQGLRGGSDPPAVLRRSGPGMMHRFAEVLSVANVYEKALRCGEGGPTERQVAAATNLVEESGRAFNRHVVQALCRLTQVYPPGATVRIGSTSSGRYVGFTAIVRENQVWQDEYPRPSTLLLTHNAKGMSIPPTEADVRGERSLLLDLVI